MKKTIIVTPNANIGLISHYPDTEIVALDEGIEVCKEANIRMSLAISSFETVSLDDLLSYFPKEKIMKYEHSHDEEFPLSRVCNYLFSHGVEDILVLDSFSDLLHAHELSLLLKNAKGHLSIQDSSSLVNFYGEGSHVISKLNYSAFTIIGFPYANVSMEHVSRNIKDQELHVDKTHNITNAIFERVAVLKVNKGGVLFVLHD